MDRHPLECLALRLGALERQVEHVLLAAIAVDHHHGRESVARHIGGRLGEELVGERHMPLIDVVHVREIGNIGHSVGIGGGDDGGNDALEAVPQPLQRNHAAASGISLRPAPGPGVCSKISCGSIVRQTRSWSDSVLESCMRVTPSAIISASCSVT